jgi:hypothetical protein
MVWYASSRVSKRPTSTPCWRSRHTPRPPHARAASRVTILNNAAAPCDARASFFDETGQLVNQIAVPLQNLPSKHVRTFCSDSVDIAASARFHENCDVSIRKGIGEADKEFFGHAVVTTSGGRDCAKLAVHAEKLTWSDPTAGPYRPDAVTRLTVVKANQGNAGD